MAGKNWIAGAVKKPGELHRDLNVKQGKKLTEADLERAEDRGGKVAQRARFAENMRHLNKRRAR